MPPCDVREDHAALALAEDVLAEIHGRRPLRVRMGGSIPIGPVFAAGLGIETIYFSFSTADEDFHAPNEFIRLASLREGLRAWTRYWEALARITPAELRR